MRNPPLIHCVINVLVKKKEVCKGVRIMFIDYAFGAEVCHCWI